MGVSLVVLRLRKPTDLAVALRKRADLRFEKSSPLRGPAWSGFGVFTSSRLDPAMDV